MKKYTVRISIPLYTVVKVEADSESQALEAAMDTASGIPYKDWESEDIQAEVVMLYSDEDESYWNPAGEEHCSRGEVDDD